MKILKNILAVISFSLFTNTASAYEVNLGYGILQDGSNSSIIAITNDIRNHDVFVLHNIGNDQNARRILNALNVYHNEYSMQTTRSFSNNELKNEAIIWRNTSIDYDGKYTQYDSATSGFESAPLSIAFRTRRSGGHPFVVSTFDIHHTYHNKWQSSQYMNQYVNFVQSRFNSYRLQVMIGDGVFIPSGVNGVTKTESGFFVPNNMKSNVYNVSYNANGVRTMTIDFPDSRIIN